MHLLIWGAFLSEVTLVMNDFNFGLNWIKNLNDNQATFGIFIIGILSLVSGFKGVKNKNRYNKLHYDISVSMLVGSVICFVLVFLFLVKIFFF